MPVVEKFFKIFVAIYSGIPGVVTMLIFHLIYLSLFKPAKNGIMLLAYFTFTLGRTIVVSESVRGAFLSIPKGQYEAAKVLGYRPGQTFFRIVLPQVIKRIVPAMGNEVITLVKDTALVSVIGVSELLMVAKERQGALFSFVPLFIAGVFYFIMNWIVSIGFQKLEKKLAYYN